MIFIFYFLAAVLVFTSWKSFRGGINYLNFFKKELAKPKSNFTPFVSIIAPCRGLDAGLEENLSALLSQNFPNYEILFVVDDKTDEAVAVIEKIIQKNSASAKRLDCGSNRAKLIVAGKAATSAQKVHNLREAVLQICEESEIFVFVDSDARPNANWLRNLIAPLQDAQIGAATGYRWFISEKRNLASEMLAIWNASIASALGANAKTNFCWGGSTAIRRETFEKLQIRKKWRGVLSDDFTVTQAFKEANLPICFVPQALTASIANCSFAELLEFTTRQMKITRVYAPRLWRQSFVGAFLFNLVFVWGILIFFFNKIGDFSFWFALVALAAICVFSIGKAHLRLSAVKLVLKDYASKLDKQSWAQTMLWLFAPALFFYNDFRALFSQKITWRGIEYEMISTNQTSILKNK